MSIDAALAALAAFVHANISVISVASALVIAATLLGDGLDVAIFVIQNGWRKLSLNVALSVLAADPANATAAGAAALAFLGALGAGAGYRDAAITALVAIGTVNTGYLLGADRDKFAVVLDAVFRRKKPATA